MAASGAEQLPLQIDPAEKRVIPLRLKPMLPAAYVDGMYNVSEMDGTAGITIVWVRPDGTALWNFGETMADLEPFLSASPLEQLLPNAWTFRLNPETGQWQLNGMRHTGG